MVHLQKNNCHLKSAELRLMLTKMQTRLQTETLHEVSCR